MDTPPTISFETGVLAFDKRCVVLVTSGPYAGLHQINGTVSQLAGVMGQLPDFIPHVSMPPDNRMAPAGLVAFKGRFVLYKEINGPAMVKPGTFHPEQR